VLTRSLGAGSILDTTRIGVPVLAVPNPRLLDNHQEELARRFATMGYLYHGRLGYGKFLHFRYAADQLCSHLKRAIIGTEHLRDSGNKPLNTGIAPKQADLSGILDDEMGFVD
jgi:hypothetical protein